MNDETEAGGRPNAIAIVGAAVHAPGASDVDSLWQKLLEGHDLSEVPSDAQLRERGVDERTLHHPRYVKRTFSLPHLRAFDPAFFGFTPRDAELADPQLRHLLECSWEALEDAAIDPTRPTGPIGLFTGLGPSDYLRHHLLGDPELVETHGLDKLLQLGNDRDYVASRIAYALDLRGPVLNVGAACASGALAVHMACQSLLGRECRIALAGAASIVLPHGTGYLYEAGGLLSPDGVCRAFDADARGTLPSSAIAAVTLMRLDDALSERRPIYATILATAHNNDGRRKVGFAAPSVDGPLSGIEEVLAVADVEARSVGYVEAHGTGTPFGDSIEVAALTRAFRNDTDALQFCVLGANKPHLGHTDAASGLLSLIKTACVLAERTLPPLLHFQAPHPLLELPSSPFRVQRARAHWDAASPRRALVNCFAIGGSNVHTVLEEAPASFVHDAALDRRPELLVLSARTRAALRAQQTRLARHLERRPELALRDVAHTLRSGRQRFEQRAAWVVTSREDALAQLRGEPARDVPADAIVLRLIELARRFVEQRDDELGLDARDDLDEPASDKPIREKLPSPHFVHLPSYPFERRTCWIEPRAHQSAAAPVLPDNEVPLSRARFVEAKPSLIAPRAGQRWLVLVDETGFGERVVLRLRALGCQVVSARLGHGPALMRVGSDEYRIDCDRGFEGPSALIRELARDGRLPEVVLHLWTVTTEERFRSATNRFHHDVERGYFAVLALCQGLSSLEHNTPLRLIGITNDAVSVADEEVGFPAKTLLFGPLAAFAREQPGLTAVALDVDLPAAKKRALLAPQLRDRAYDRVADALLREVAGRPTGVYAMRGETVFERVLEPVAPLTPKLAPISPGGTYIVIGGFGNLGYAIAQEQASRAPIKLVLVGRTPLPDAGLYDDWLRNHPDDDPVSKRIRMVRALESRGSDVLAVTADICHFESLAAGLSLVRRRFGAIHGVVHAAGGLAEALASGQTLDEARDAFAPEVLGARVLASLLQREPLAFLVLVGSASRFAPRAGTAARIAASEFSEAFCEAHRTLGARSYDLGLVRDGGMFVQWAHEVEAAGAPRDPRVRALLREVARGMTTQQAARSVVDALASDVRKLVIGRVPAIDGVLRGPSLPLARSALEAVFVAPEGELERKLAALWADVLRIDKVGANDDFFALGGHSLIAVRLTARIERTFHVAVPLASLIEAPTVRALAALLGEQLARRGAPQVLRRWTTVVPLQPRGSRPPLFCVGGKGGNVMNLRHLATLLGRDQPVYGLQARGVDGAQKPHDTLEAMVDEYLQDSARVCAKGPYFLSGFSGGGAIILELARKLACQGQSVGPLLFFDAWNPAAPSRSLPQNVRAHAALFRDLGPRYAQLYASRLATERLQSTLRRRAPSIADRIWEAVPSLGEVGQAWELAAAHYVPAPYDGSAVLFRVRADRSRGELDHSDDEHNGWATVIRGGVEVIDVPGTHTSIVEEPHVRTLAQSLRAVLDRALADYRQEAGGSLVTCSSPIPT